METVFTFATGATGGCDLPKCQPKAATFPCRVPSVPEPWVLDISADGSDLLIEEFLKLDGMDRPVWIASLPNGPLRRVGGLMVNGAAFLPGSNKLLYDEAAHPKQFFMADLDGSNARSAFSAPDDIHEYIVSPDGKTVRFAGTGGRIWEFGLDGSGIKPFLPEHSRPMRCGRWSNDGRTYAFVSEDPEAEKSVGACGAGMARPQGRFQTRATHQRPNFIYWPDVQPGREADLRLWRDSARGVGHLRARNP